MGQDVRAVDQRQVHTTDGDASVVVGGGGADDRSAGTRRIVRAIRRAGDSTEERGTNRSAGTPGYNTARGPGRQGNQEGATDAVVTQGLGGDPVPDRLQGNKDNTDDEGDEPHSWTA